MKNKPVWEVHIGFYPGILLGVRSYKMGDYDDHVLYLPLIDFCLTIYKQNVNELNNYKGFNCLQITKINTFC